METRTILLVEDEPKDEALMIRAFRKYRIRNEIVVARDGAQALDYLFQRGEYAGRVPIALPDLVLLDLKLPKVDGLEVLRQLRAGTRTRLLPVVMLSSSDEDRDRLRSYELGANSYVRKPIEFARLRETVQQIGIYWLVLNRPPPPLRESAS